jgi:putative ABC transport system permease protein
MSRLVLGQAADVVACGLEDLWAHKLRSLLTLTLLMLGVFALVVMNSMLDGILDQVRVGFRGMGWDGALVLQPRAPASAAEQRRFPQSPGLRLEDLPRVTQPDPRILAFLPRAVLNLEVRGPAGAVPAPVSGIVPDYLPVMERRIAAGRGLSPEDQGRRSPVAVLGASLAARLMPGTDPVGQKILLNGQAFRVVGVLAPFLPFSHAGYQDGHGVLVPLAACMDRLVPDHRLDSITVKLAATRDLEAVSALLLGRARQAHHGVEDVEVRNLDADAARAYGQFRANMRNWRIVLWSLAGTVLLVGGVGVLSVMLISFADRRFEIGLRKAVGASDPEILVQFLLEAGVLTGLGALSGSLAGILVCRVLAPRFPMGLVVAPMSLGLAWAVALALGLGFGLYPALRAMRLSPMAAMR